MLARYRRLLADVRASYSPAKAAEEKRGEFLAYVLYRPVSFGVTPLFMLARFSADSVTALMLGLAVAMPAVAAWGGGHAYGWVVAIGLSLQVLDCVDGNIARVTRKFSRVGDMLDGLCTLLFWALYFFTVGILAHDDTGNWIARHGRELGLGLAALFLAQREMEDTFDHAFQERVRTAPPVPGAAGLDLGQLAKPVEQILAFGGLALAGTQGWLPVFLTGLVVYQTGVFVLWLPRFVRAVLRRR